MTKQHKEGSGIVLVLEHVSNNFFWMFCKLIRHEISPTVFKVYVATGCNRVQYVSALKRHDRPLIETMLLHSAFIVYRKCT